MLGISVYRELGLRKGRRRLADAIFNHQIFQAGILNSNQAARTPRLEPAARLIGQPHVKEITAGGTGTHDNIPSLHDLSPNLNYMDIAIQE